MIHNDHVMIKWRLYIYLKWEWFWWDWWMRLMNSETDICHYLNAADHVCNMRACMHNAYTHWQEHSQGEVLWILGPTLWLRGTFLFALVSVQESNFYLTMLQGNHARCTPGTQSLVRTLKNQGHITNHGAYSWARARGHYHSSETHSDHGHTHGSVALSGL